MLVLAVGTLGELPLPLERKIELAFHAILRHELFHFAADCMAANWELSLGMPVYWPAKAKLCNATNYIELEEALANAHSCEDTGIRIADLARSVQLNGLGFQKWKPGGPDSYSVNVDGNYRVHLRRDRSGYSWFAETIGDHKSMGHG